MLRTTCSRCGRLIQYGKQCQCYKQDKRERDRIYDREERNKDTADIYHSQAWAVARDAARARDNGLCLMCLADNHITPCEMVHHIKEASERPDLAYDVGNLICLCNSCQASVHVAYEKDNGTMQEKLKGLISDAL